MVKTTFRKTTSLCYKRDPQLLTLRLGYISCDLDPKVKVKDQIMYFLVNASSHKLFEAATSNFACA